MATRDALDIIGDIHGELGALLELAKKLGYDVGRADWPHPEGRRLVFLGDLVDRGAHSLEVAETVRRLHASNRAACLMGNHEYNLVAHHLGVPDYERPKKSNAKTIDEIRRNRAAWAPILDFFRELPLALELPDLRMIHACWHVGSVEAVRRHLAPRPARPGEREHWAAAYVALRSPFEPRGLHPDLPTAAAGQDDAPHEILMKGYEEPAAAPFHDTDGTERDRVRATWWLEDDAPVLRDRPLVVGHYWNVPPMDGTFCPPYPSGHPKLREWQRARAPAVPSVGERACTAEIICVDYNGVTAESDRACVGALRWPEREVVWATSARTRSGHGE